MNREQEAARASQLEQTVGNRIQAWATDALGGELEAAYKQFSEVVGKTSGAPPALLGAGELSDAHMTLFSTWFHNDRLLSDGTTPAGRYAELSDIDAREREVAARIAAARLRVYRVLEVEAGRSITIEDLVDNSRHTASSDNISRQATRWDLLVARVMGGERASLWGSSRLVPMADEEELMAEIARLGSTGDAADREDAERSAPAGDTLATVLDAYPLQLLLFRPASRHSDAGLFTLEGDPVVEASATWAVSDIAAVDRRLRTLGQLNANETPEINITFRRELLIRRRGPLPPGALILEESTDGAIDTVPFATLRLDGEQLTLEAMSEQRLDRAIEIVRHDFGALIELIVRRVVPISKQLDEDSSALTAGEGDADPALERLTEAFLTSYMHRWIDDPNPQLGGLTPRQAAASPKRSELLHIVRKLENGADHGRRDGSPQADLSWLREELGVEEELAGEDPSTATAPSQPASN